MPKYRDRVFSNANDVDDFFQKLSSKKFVDWFNSNIAGKQNWSGKKIQSGDNWNKLWSNASILFNKSSFNLVEFLCLNSFIINETGGTFLPLSEVMGSKGHPGISFAFDKITGLKDSYNTLVSSGNMNAYQLFNDSIFKSVHVTKPFGSLLKDTTDNRWSGDTFPTGFSGKISSEVSVTGKSNGFIYESDFVKFRGRGYLQTRGRTFYKQIIKFILGYSGVDSVINEIKSVWTKYESDLDAIASISTNKQWDDLFQKTNSIIANYALWENASTSKYIWIDPNTSDSVLQKAIVTFAKNTSALENSSYPDLFYGRVMQQLNLIESLEDPNATNIGASASVTPVEPPTQEVSREERTNEDPNSNNTEKNNSGKIPGITNIFPPTIKPSPIKFNLPPQKDIQNEIAYDLGNFPFVWYNAYQIAYKDISFFQLYTSNNMPCMKVVFSDTLNKMKDQGFPLDDSKIKIFLNPRTNQLKPIFIEFKIVKFSINSDVYTITGSIDVSKLYTKSFKSLSKMSSYKALQEISKESGLGFNTNIDDTDDKMTWINTGHRTIDFIDSIVDNSYKSDDTFLLYYIDFYYNLNYVDLEKELNRDIKQELGVDNIGIEDVANIKDQERVSRLFLTNDYSRKNTNGFFESYKIINNSTSISIDEGYSSKVKFYDELTKDFLVFDVDSITSKGDKSIILKGSPQDEKFFNENINLIYTGKLDGDNMHKNYHYSHVQNNRNIVELQKIGIEIEMFTPNYTIYKFQKIFVFLSNQASTPSTPHVNNRLTGEWFIIDIKYRFDGDKFRQIVKLIRRELDLSPEELSGEPIQNRSRGKDGSRNYDDANGSDNLSDNPNDPSVITNDDDYVDDGTFPLTKEIFRLIYKGKINPKVIELYYEPMKSSMIKYGINTKARIAAFLSQVNAETGYLIYVTELASGNEYEGRSDLGNTQAGDGRKFKGRGLVQITGRSNYNATGKYLNKDFISDPSIVSAENDTHRKGAATQEQITNSILTSIRFWLKGSAWGNLNDIADKMDIRRPINLGSVSLSQVPNTHAAGKQYGSKRNNNFATRYNPNDANFTNFTLICFGINGGYNGYRDRIENWTRIREFFK